MLPGLGLLAVGAWGDAYGQVYGQVFHPPFFL